MVLGHIRADDQDHVGSNQVARRGGGAAAPGMLVALRGVELHCDRIDDLPGPLECEAELLIDGDAGWQYGFRVLHDGSLLAAGRAAVMPQAKD